MATPATVNPFNFYPGRDGLPLQNGYLYFGEPFQDPELQPLQAYWDDANTQPAARPIRTINGYPARNGAPAQVFVGAQYSMRVRDSQGREVFYAPNVTAVDLGGGGLDIITASGGQTVVTLTNAVYTPGSNAIDIALNGIIQISGQDYFETGTDRITMASALSAGDQIRAFARSTFGLTQAVLSDWQYQLFSGTGAQTNFTLTRSPGALANLDVSLSGVVLKAGIDYTLSGTTLTLAVAPPAAANNLFVRYGRSLPQDALRGELASTASAADGAGIPALNAMLNYAAASLGRRAVLDYWTPADYPWLAKFDGSTDDTAAINACATACRATTPRKIMRLPQGKCIVSGSLDFSGLVIDGAGKGATLIQATSAQFDVITTTGDTELSDFTVHGGWDGSTPGLSGDIFSATATMPALPYNIHLRNLAFTNAKKRCIYIARGGYSSIWNVKCNAAGLDVLELWGDASVQCTTIQIAGYSIFSDAPFGFGVKMTECVNVSFNSVISEYAGGIQLNGTNNRAISFNSFYQENTVGGEYIDWNGSSGIGLEVSNSFGGGSSIAYTANWTNQTYRGNAALTEPAIPVDGQRIILSDGGENTVVAAGSVTAASIALPPGTWAVHAYVQTLDSSAGTVDKLGARLTTDSTVTGLAFSTATLDFGAEAIYLNPGALANLRVTPFDVILNTTTSNVTWYLRAYIGRTAGTVAYRGAIKAVRIS